MTAVPARHDQLAGVQEAGSAELRWWVRLVPDDELEGVEGWVEGLVPPAEQVVRGEREQRARRLQHAPELAQPRGRVERELVPRRDVVVDRLAPGHLDVAGRIRAEVVRRVGADEVDRRVRKRGEEIATVPMPERRPAVRRGLDRRGPDLDHGRIVPRRESTTPGPWARRVLTWWRCGVRPAPDAPDASGTARPDRRCR